ncbi:MAG: phosphatase PAP2 family protein, partial [Candidatus Dormibacterales bacterium]
LVALATAVHLARRGRTRAAWGMAAFPVAVALETLYKRLVHHPGPGGAITHADAPSLTSLFAHTSLLQNSFPSGHVTRAVVVYGLLAFAVWAGARSVRARGLAAAAAAVVVAAIAFDRLYLEVHWESDVVGGLLLGGICLVGAIIWVELPRLAGRP